MRDRIDHTTTADVVVVKEDGVDADNGIYIGIADVSQDLERRLLFVRNPTIRSKEEALAQKEGRPAS